MPRSAIIDAPGVLHHLIIRGIERRNIFRTSEGAGRCKESTLFWAVRGLGIKVTSLAKQFEMSQPGVVCEVNKGEKIPKKPNFKLIE